jgi:serine O-acetyltransferase
MKRAETAHTTLEAIIDDVAESYSAGRNIDNLESAALPNKRRVEEALQCLQHVMYMGFYSSRFLNSVNLRQGIGEHLYDAFETLVEQISRAVAYSRKGGGAPDEADQDWSERVVLEVFQQIAGIREQLALDVDAAYQGDPAAAGVEEIIFSYPAVDAITVYRIAHQFYIRQVPLIPRIMCEYAHGLTGIDIHPGARIGRSFFIDHGTGVVIGATAEIGDNCKVYQGVTLGAESFPHDEQGELVRTTKRHPTIEDNVTIYAGATILGGKTVIGAGSLIGSNVWLTQSIPPNTRVIYTTPTDGKNSQTIEPVRPRRNRAG